MSAFLYTSSLWVSMVCKYGRVWPEESRVETSVGGVVGLKVGTGKSAFDERITEANGLTNLGIRWRKVK